MFLLVIRT